MSALAHSHFNLQQHIIKRQANQTARGHERKGRGEKKTLRQTTSDEGKNTYGKNNNTEKVEYKKAGHTHTRSNNPARDRCVVAVVVVVFVVVVEGKSGQ